MNSLLARKIVVTSRQELQQIIEKRIKEFGPECSLNDLDVSNITDMSKLFFNSDFNGDISEWDVFNVEDMSYMFSGSIFSKDISSWNIIRAWKIRHLRIILLNYSTSLKWINGMRIF